MRKTDNSPDGQKRKWDKFELDGITSHICHKPLQQQKQERQPPNSNYNLSREITAIKAQLLVLVSRLDRIEAELRTHVS